MTDAWVDKRMQKMTTLESEINGLVSNHGLVACLEALCVVSESKSMVSATRTLDRAYAAMTGQRRKPSG